MKFSIKKIFSMSLIILILIFTISNTISICKITLGNQFVSKFYFTRYYLANERNVSKSIREDFIVYMGSRGYKLIEQEGEMLRFQKGSEKFEMAYSQIKIIFK